MAGEVGSALPTSFGPLGPPSIHGLQVPGQAVLVSQLPAAQSKNLLGGGWLDTVADASSAGDRTTAAEDLIPLCHGAGSMQTIRFASRSATISTRPSGEKARMFPS